MKQQVKTRFKTPEGLYTLQYELLHHVQPEILDELRREEEPNKSFVATPRRTFSSLLYTNDTLDLLITPNCTFNDTILAQLDHLDELEETSETPTRPKSVKKKELFGFYISLNTPEKLFLYNLLSTNNECELPPSGEELAPTTALQCKGGKPTCHTLCFYQTGQQSSSAAMSSSITTTTSSSSVVDVLVGFDTGDIFIHRPLSNQTISVNKDRLIDKSPVTAVSWCGSAGCLIPHNVNNSTSLSSSKDVFVVCHKSGNLYVYNKHFVNETPLFYNNDKEKEQQMEKQFYFVLNKNKESNPIAKFHLSHKKLNAISFSPDGRLISVATDDGYLKVINFKTCKIEVIFRSFYGAILCCCWSPDGKYIVTGGEDDMITVLDLQKKSILARGIGHTNFVSAIVFDPFQCNEDRYRIVSVGQDAKLVLWDIDKIDMISNETCEGGIEIPNSSSSSSSSSSHTRKKNVKNNGISKTSSSTSLASISTNHSDNGEEDSIPVVLSKKLMDVPIFEPISLIKAHIEPIHDVLVFEQGIITLCNMHIVKIWRRPS